MGKTLRQEALEGKTTERMVQAADAEGIDPKHIREGLASGKIAVTGNRNRLHVRPMAVGEGLRVKVNANIGTSPHRNDPEDEMRKLEAAVGAGADAVMDLSIGGDLNGMRRMVLERCPVAVGTVPVYQAVAGLRKSGRSLHGMTSDDIFSAVERQVVEGVDFITVHCGVTVRSLAILEDNPRVMGVVSRGGALIMEWMTASGRENPLYEEYDRLLEIAREHDVVLSLGDGLRPGCLADAGDKPQIEELKILGELTLRAWEAGIQVMIEGPGHVPMHRVEENVRMEKELCHGAPFYVLGPLVTDIAPGYDHISSAIGGALAAMAGADFLCYVTPAEHLRLPELEDVVEGVMAARLAGHAGDIARGLPGAAERDLRMSRCRRKLDWLGQMEHALNPALIEELRRSGEISEGEVCSMCGEFCPLKKG
jgi:phosphomethylpyrimidine synthase